MVNLSVMFCLEALKAILLLKACRNVSQSDANDGKNKLAFLDANMLE